MIKWKTLNKYLTFTHLYKVFVSCVKLCSHMGDSNSPAHLHWRRWLGPAPLLIFSECSKLAFRAGFGSGKWYGVLCVRDTRNSHGISFQDGNVTPKLMHGLAPLFHAPQSYELAISRTKRGGVEVIMASCIFQTLPVWSVVLLPECWHWLPHTPSHSTSNLLPLIQHGGSRKFQRNAQSFLFT